MLESKHAAFALLVPGVLAVIIACSEGATEDRQAVNQQQAPNTQDFHEEVVIGSGELPTSNASSLEAMAATYEAIVVGEVISAADASCPPDVATPDFDPDQMPPPDSPKAKLTPGFPSCAELPPSETFYSVRVIRSLRSTFVSGDTLQMAQAGGIKGGIAYIMEYDPIIEVGKTYLFFVRPANPSDPSSQYVGSPFGRFEIDASGLLTAVDDTWSYLVAVDILAGNNIEQADALIDQAEAAGPPPGFE